MKISLIYIWVICLILSCSKDNFEYQSDYERSYLTFQNFKKDNNNAYIYKTTYSSWLGITTEYTFEIINGKVVSRSFIYANIGQTKRPESGWTKEIATSAFRTIGYSEEELDRFFDEEDFLNKLEWSETSDKLGTKENPNNIWTLDEIYTKAKTEWLITNANIYFEAKNNGLISLCGYTDQNCQDDCFVGIKISSIKPLEQ